MEELHNVLRETALNYIEGFFSGNVERIDKALHPMLAKRGIYNHPQSGDETLHELKKEDMVEYTRKGYGKRVPEDQWNISVDILNTGEKIAMVRVESSQFIDYLHMVKDAGTWQILNVLWEPAPKK